jgi:hypothetical protein
MTITPASRITRGEGWAWRSSSDLFRLLTSIQFMGLIAFLILSAIDVVISTFLFFGGGGGFIEANPVLAWASEDLFVFLAAVLAVKAIGAGALALLASFGNHFSTLVGDATVLAAVCTTMALFLLQLIT